MRSFLNTRSFHIAAAVLAALSLVCTRVPLLNYLGFEFSTVTALTAGYIAGLLVLSWRSRSQQDEGLWQFVISSTAALLALLFIPFLVMTANALIVKNCSFAQGALLYVLIVHPAVLFSGALALLLAVALKKWKKTWFTVFYMAILCQVLFVTVTGPQIFAFNPILGFFPGVTYDESLYAESRLLSYRFGTLTEVGLLLVLSTVLHRMRTRSSREARTSSWLRSVMISRWEYAAIAICGLSVMAMFVYSDELGHSSSERHIRGKLGGVFESENFVITFPADRLTDAEAKELALFHEFHFSRLSRELRVWPGRKIQSFIYASPEQKLRLIGAGGTNIAKPWLWQLHLNLDDVEAALKHELVHVMAAQFGFPLIRIGLNPGLIEGLATAVERKAYDETLHRLAAQIFALNLNLDVEVLFSFSGFMKAQPAVSYALAGSLCRYLIDGYGIRRFKRLYQTGSFARVYNKDLEQLVAEWRRYLNHHEISREELEKAAYLFKRPSIFGKECARVMANLNAETRRLMEGKKFEEALRSSSQALDLSISPTAVVQHATSLLRLRRHSEMIDFAVPKLKDTTIAHALIPLTLSLGDAYWATGTTAEAANQFRRLRSIHLSPGHDEAAELRLEALSIGQGEERFVSFFTDSLADSVKIDMLRNFAGSNQLENVLARYLLGRELMAKERYNEALTMFSQIPRMQSDNLEFMRRSRIAKAYYKLKQYQKAKIYLWQSLNLTSSQARIMDIEEWIKRCDWMDEMTKADLS